MAIKIVGRIEIEGSSCFSKSTRLTDSSQRDSNKTIILVKMNSLVFWHNSCFNFFSDSYHNNANG